MQPWALVTPASRGIGLELARRLLQTSNVPVIATARKDLDQTKENVLSGLKNVKEDRLHVLKVDVLGTIPVCRVRSRTDCYIDEQSIADAAEQASKLFPKDHAYLHLSLCVPGMLVPEKAPSQINYEDALLTFKTNTIGPMMLIKHFAPFLPRKSTRLEADAGLPSQAIWATMGARVGSITDNRLGGWFSYRSSKAAVTQLAKTFDNNLSLNSGDKAISIALHPGTVKTGLSKGFWESQGTKQLLSPEYACEKLMEVVNSRTLDHRGRFYDWKGEEIPP